MRNINKLKYLKAKELQTPQRKNTFTYREKINRNTT